MWNGDVAGGYLITVIMWIAGAFIAYFVIMHVMYLMFIAVGIANLRKYRHYTRVADFYALFKTTLSKPISVLVPAFNEEENIVESVKSLLALKYPQFEVVVVDDGSEDSTLSVLEREFKLIRRNRIYQRKLDTEPVNAVYESDDFPNLVVVSKVNGGKSDALNCGINVSSYPYFCVLDADSVLERDALLKMIRPVIQEPDSTVAVGGIVRVGNGCTVEHGEVKEVQLPNNWIALAQVVEYLQAFLASRVALSEWRWVLLISGAFGLFKKATVVDVGGYRRDTVGEDMELIVRINKQMRKQNRKYRIVFTPDPVCWTEVPSDFGSLAKQRIRWQKGLVDSIRFNAEMMLNPQYGRIGMLALPYYAFFELTGPIIETLGYVFMITALLSGLLGWVWLLLFMLFATGMGLLVTTGTILLEEISFHRYPRPIDLVKLLWGGIHYNIWFRPFNAVVRTWAMITYPFTSRKWGSVKRTGFKPGKTQATSGRA